MARRPTHRRRAEKSKPGRKVVLIPTARPEGLAACVRSFIENAHRHRYDRPVHFVVADYTSPQEAQKNKRVLKDLERHARKSLGLRNVRIHHFGPREQARILSEMLKSDPKRWKNLRRYVGSLSSTPDGYGPARNRATVLAYSKGLLDRPDDIAILFDDDLYAKNLTRVRRRHTGGLAKQFGRESEGDLVLRDTGSYFHNIDRYFEKRPDVLMAGGGITFDGDVAAQDVIGGALDAVLNFLRMSRGVKRPKAKKMGNLKNDEGISMARIVFSRKFLGPMSVHSGFLNLVRKAYQSVGRGRIAFNPHWVSGGEGIPSKVQVTRGAGNLCVRPKLLFSYPFITSSERGEDAVLYSAVEADMPQNAIGGFFNPVAHIKRAGRASAYSNIALEPGETYKVPEWRPKIREIRALLMDKEAWWSHPRYANQIRSLRNLVDAADAQMRAIISREGEKAIPPKTPSKDSETAVIDASRERLFGRYMRPNRQARMGAGHHPLMPKYRKEIEPWRRMFQTEKLYKKLREGD